MKSKYCRAHYQQNKVLLLIQQSQLAFEEFELIASYRYWKQPTTAKYKGPCQLKSSWTTPSIFWVSTQVGWIPIPKFLTTLHTNYYSGLFFRNSWLFLPIFMAKGFPREEYYYSVLSIAVIPRFIAITCPCPHRVLLGPQCQKVSA